MLTLKMLTMTLHEVPALAFSLFTGYLIGSFPTAYLLVKWKASVDIRNAGTGNVGTHNAFDVTGSKSIAVAVLLLDIAKGFTATWLCGALYGPDFWFAGLGGIGAVVGHNYPVWLRFKGGRGLAPSVGVMLDLGWICVVLWCIGWLAVWSVSHRLHLANVAASVLSPLMLWGIPAAWIAFSIPAWSGGSNLVIALAVICTLILLKHAEYFGDIRKSLTIHS